MNLKEAAAALEVSEKTVSRYAAAGRLPQRYIQGKTGRQLDFDEADITRLKQELAASIERAVVVDGEPKQGQTGQDTTLSVLAPSMPVDAQIGALAQLVRAVMDAGQGETRHPDTVVPISKKMLLTLDEARALTGLSRGVLVAAIKAGELQALTLGRGYKLLPSDVESWLEKMFKTPKRAKK